ncbi:paraquat-inducible membrane protein A [Acetobacter estunensis]|uniref:Paraquat-inducible membrane protein A n=1 Tax=Acetobacter estunensis TaxID=104097 RepID=A0A967B9C2_9PROT|nr:paraquat-inducible protein A [Acetobacter estunensis]NHO54724.1 paraquat-inducible membrane protein A [Acetobacter estunensis]
MPSSLPLRLYRGAIQLARRPRRQASHVTVVDGLVECPCCGEFQELDRVQPGTAARCVRCGQVLERRNKTAPLAAPLAFCITSAALYLATLASSLMTLDLYGRERTVNLLTGPMELLHEGWGEVGMLVGIVTVLAPGIVIAIMGLILTAGFFEELPDWAPNLMAWYDKLRPWSMMEVYILGIFVAYTKLVDLAHVEVGTACYLIAALMISMAATDQTLDQEWIWQRRRVEGTLQLPDGRRMKVDRVSVHDLDGLPPHEHMLSCHSCGLVGVFPQPVPQTDSVGVCPRCGHDLRRRKVNSISRTVALLLSAFIFYFPANLFPVMTVIKVGNGTGHTIIEGAIELWEDGMIPLSLLVLFASVTVPVAKIVGLTYMIWTTKRRSAKKLLFRSKLFRMIDIIGRWSMIDVFMISILVAVVRFSSLANIRANAGVVSFAAVVVLTIFAAHCFDPRLMWDAAGRNGKLRADAPPRSDNTTGQSCLAHEDEALERGDMEPVQA